MACGKGAGVCRACVAERSSWFSLSALGRARLCQWLILHSEQLVVV